MMLNPRRRAAAIELDGLSPAQDWEEIYRRFTLWEHPHEVRLGFQLAFYSPLSVPRMARLLRRTGHFSRTPEKRAYDTGIVMYEIIEDGFAGPRAAQMIDLMDRLHGRHHAIRQDDMSYVLCGLIVEPVRLVDRAGWRKATANEKQASVRWYAELAQRMGIEWWPETYDEAEQWFDAYRADHARTSEDSKQLAAATMHVLQHRMPRPIRPLARPITAAVIGDRALVESLGLGPYSPQVRAAVDLLFRLRALATRTTAPRRQPIFRPGQDAGVAYPTGYQLDQIGPDLTTEDETMV